MWHSLGKIKQSGWKAVDKPGGRRKTVAEAVKMHNGYDCILAGAPIWNHCYCESFGCSEDAILNIGLPRMDFIRERSQETRQRLLDKFSFLAEGNVVIYAPTFRRNNNKAPFAIDVTRLEDPFYVLVVKAHDNQPLIADVAMRCQDTTTLELLSVADVLITDYSAVALEAAWANVPTLYYCPDFNEYAASTGLNINIFEEMPGCVFDEANELILAVKRALRGEYPLELLNRYREKYLLGDDAQPTQKVVSLILNRMI